MLSGIPLKWQNRWEFRLRELKICGGGAKSPLWKKMIANILNVKVDVIESEEGPALGGAMLAAVANGEYTSVEEAAEKIVKVIDTVEPEPELAAKYEEKISEICKNLSDCKRIIWRNYLIYLRHKGKDCGSTASAVLLCYTELKKQKGMIQSARYFRCTHPYTCQRTCVQHHAGNGKGSF